MTSHASLYATKRELLCRMLLEVSFHTQKGIRYLDVNFWDVRKDGRMIEGSRAEVPIVEGYRAA